MDHTKKKIIITGGHLTPAWITAKELLKNGYSNLLWVGTKYTQKGDTSTSPEFQLVNELDIAFFHFKTGKLWRKWNKFTYKNAILDILLIPYGFGTALIKIIKEKPAMILSFGGYVSLPFVIFGKLLGKKIITHEQVLSPGLSSKIVAKFADKILISWPETEKFFNKSKTELTGNPSWVMSQNRKTDTINFNTKLPIVTIIGGNQGAKVVNASVFAALPDLLQVANVIHQTGRSEVTGDKYKASEIKSELPENLKERYVFFPYISDNIYEIMEKSDLIVTRGGANAMTDIIAKSKKSIVIPIPWSSGEEQLKNAKYMEELGLAAIIQYEKDINPEQLLNLIKQELKREIPKTDERLKRLKNLIRYAPTKIFSQIELLLKA